MTDQWVPAPPPVPGPPPVNFPLADSWNRSVPCPVGENIGIVDGVIITGVPATIGSVVNGNYAWTITLNDGNNPPSFSIDHYDSQGNLINSPIFISGLNGGTQFSGDVYLYKDPTSPMEAATKEYVDQHSAGVTEAPVDGRQYGRQSEGWTVINNPIASDAPSDGNQYGRQNGNWTQVVPPAITSDAPNDGSAYVRQNLGWFPLSASLTGYLPLTGGFLSGQLNFNNAAARILAGFANGSTTQYRWAVQLGDALPEIGGNAGANFNILSFNDAGTAVLTTPLSITRPGAITVNAPSGLNPITINGAASTWRSIAASTAGSLRWQMYLANPSAELGGNLGSNFSLNSYTDAGTALATPLQIARQTGIATFSAIPSFPGGAAGQALTTNGAGVLSWGSVASGPPVIVGDLPPANPVAGTLWFDSVGGQTYVWYTDPTTSQWVIAVNASGTPTVSIGAAPPGNASVGQLWWDGVGAQLYVYYNDGNSTQWVPTTNQLGGNFATKADVAPLLVPTLASAHMSADVASGVGNIQVPFNTVDFDTNGEWMLPGFAAKRAGYYRATMVVGYQYSTTGAFFVQAMVEKAGGVVIQYGDSADASATTAPCSVVDVITHLNIGESLGFYLYTSTAGTMRSVICRAQVQLLALG